MDAVRREKYTTLAASVFHSKFQSVLEKPLGEADMRDFKKENYLASAHHLDQLMGHIVTSEESRVSGTREKGFLDRLHTQSN